MDFHIFCDFCQTNTCHHSTFTLDMASSHTVNPMTLMHSTLSVILPHLERSASLAEKIMLMEVLTCIASQTLDESVDSDDHFSRMWEVTIQTFNHLAELLELRTTTRSNSAMLSEVASSDLTRAEAVQEELGALTIRWLHLSQSTTSRRFGQLAERWLRAYSCDAIRPLSHMLSGDSLREFRNTAIHSNWCSEMREYLIWLRGEKQIFATLACPAEEGTLRVRYRGGGPPALRGGQSVACPTPPSSAKFIYLGSDLV